MAEGETEISKADSFAKELVEKCAEAVAEKGCLLEAEAGYGVSAEEGFPVIYAYISPMKGAYSLPWVVYEDIRKNVLPLMHGEFPVSVAVKNSLGPYPTVGEEKRCTWG